MTDAAQTAPIDAREASMSRVQTLDTILAKAAPDAPPKEEPAEVKTETEAAKPKDGKKQSPSDRVREVIAQKKDAEARAMSAEERAEKVERENAELKARVDALMVKTEPPAASARPQRDSFDSQEKFEDALADWRLDERERTRAEAKAKEEFANVESAWVRGIDKAREELEDYDDAIGGAQIPVPDVAVVAMKRSKVGPQILYYLAKHPGEARELHAMHAIDAIARIKDIERELSAESKTEKPKSVERSKAPEPFTPAKQSPALNQAPASSFEEHRARRRAEMAGKK